MPIYSFRCPKCKTVITKMLPINQCDDYFFCEKCKSLLKRLIEPARIKFVGKGFYCNE